MEARRTEPSGLRDDRRASVFIDPNQAVIIRSAAGRAPTVEVLIRRPAESEARFDARAADKVVGSKCVAVAGPHDQQVGFDRTVVAMTHRPDRLVGAISLDPIKN